MSKVLSFSSYHNGPINCAKLSPSGSTLITCGSDSKINIFSILDPNSPPNYITSLENGHEQNVWEITFSSIIFGNIFATCGSDNKIIIWKESNKNRYDNIYTYYHNASVNVVKFCPEKYGLILLAGSSDGSISLHEYKHDKGNWDTHKINDAHKDGVNYLDWFPALPPMDFQEDYNERNNFEEDNNILMNMKFISCGNDKKIKIFEESINGVISSFKAIKEIGLEDIPRSLSVLNFTGYSYECFACGLENGEVLLFSKNNNDYEKKTINNFKHPVGKVSFNYSGTYLVVSLVNGDVSYMRQNLDGDWKLIKSK